MKYLCMARLRVGAPAIHKWESGEFFQTRTFDSGTSHFPISSNFVPSCFSSTFSAPPVRCLADFCRHPLFGSGRAIPIVFLSLVQNLLIFSQHSFVFRTLSPFVLSPSIRGLGSYFSNWFSSIHFEGSHSTVRLMRVRKAW